MAQISAVPSIAITVGAHRIVQGVSIPHPTGDPKLPPQEEYELRKKIFARCLKAISTDIKEPTMF